MVKFSGTITQGMCYSILDSLMTLEDFKNVDHHRIDFILERGLDANAWAWSYKDDSGHTIEVGIDNHTDMRHLIGSIAHEMIHIALNNFDDKNQHGRKFMAMARRIEKQLGLPVL